MCGGVGSGEVKTMATFPHIARSASLLQYSRSLSLPLFTSVLSHPTPHVYQQVDFFGQDAPVKDGKDGVMIVRYADGRATGDAMVLFDNDRDMERVLEKNKQSMGSRYVELFASSLKEFQMVYTHANS